MTARRYGQRLIAVVVPRYFRTQTELQRALGSAFSTVNDWATGKSDPRLEQLDKIADAISEKLGRRVDPLSLLADQPTGELRVEYDEDYPSRAEAVAFLGPELPSPIAERVKAIRLAANSDPGRLYWIRRLLEEHQRFLDDQAHPEQAAARREENARKVTQVGAALRDSMRDTRRQVAGDEAPSGPAKRRR